VPIAKTISSVRLTLGMKNMMGVVLDRGTMHSLGLPQAIADINTSGQGSPDDLWMRCEF